MPRALRLDVPERPGVYRIRRSNGNLLYAGTSVSLKRRINFRPAIGGAMDHQWLQRVLNLIRPYLHGIITILIPMRG